MRAPPDALDAHVVVAREQLTVDVALRVESGTTLAVLGPNGAGKSTLLHALAGLVPAGGHVRLGATVLRDSEAGVDRPVEDRPVGVVFQDDRLFPHLDARENVAFGLRSRGMPRAEARRRAEQWLAAVGLADRTRARPDRLSGGEARRVALARALVTEPALLLLDEPLAALDVTTRTAMRTLLRERLRAHEGPCLFVTHDPLDAHGLADQVLVLEAGHVVQRGAPDELSARPRSRWVADLAGVNLLPGRVAAADAVALDAGGVLHVVGVEEPTGAAVLAVVHPRAIALFARRPHGSPRNVFAAAVAAIDDEGARVRVRLGGAVPLVAEITAGAARELGVAVGSEVWAAVKASDVTVTAE